MSDVVLEVQKVCRHFGNVLALNNVSFSVPQGRIIGFVGGNGAGKTTLMRIMASLDVPNRGQVKLWGKPVLEYSDEIRNRVGWMPDYFMPPPNTLVWEFVDFFARAAGVSGQERMDRVEEVLEFTDLISIRDRPANKMSKGMNQRLCLARTLVADPDLLILDEPAAGLDPKARLEFKNLIRLLARRGKTIFISSHILSELGEMCDEFIFIDKGKIIHQGAPDSMQQSTTGSYRVVVRTTKDEDKLYEWIAMNPGIELVDQIKLGAKVNIKGEDDDVLSEVLGKMIHAGLPIKEFHMEKQNLENAFIDILKHKGVTDPPRRKGKGLVRPDKVVYPTEVVEEEVTDKSSAFLPKNEQDETEVTSE